MKVRSATISTLVLVLAGLAAAGCVSSRVVRRSDLRPGDTFARTMVYLQGGGQYEFLRVAIFPDTLVGEYTLNVERESDKDGVYYEDEIRAHRVALAVVDSVAELRRDPRKTFLYSAGAVGVGVLLYKAIDTSNSGKKGLPN
jgi:hypothetical protein